MQRGPCQVTGRGSRGTIHGTLVKKPIIYAVHQSTVTEACGRMCWQSRPRNTCRHNSAGGFQSGRGSRSIIHIKEQDLIKLMGSVREHARLQVAKGAVGAAQEVGVEVADVAKIKVAEKERLIATSEGADLQVGLAASTLGGAQGSHQPLFSFGVITDVQYADIDNRCSFQGVPRYYRHSLESLHRSVDAWNHKGCLSFAIHFGDIVDGYCPRENSRVAFNRVLSEFNGFQGGPIYHMLGNHCLYNLPRAELNHLLGIPPSLDGHSYYSFCPYPGFRFVVLDGYDVSALGPAGHLHTEAGVRLLETKNPNVEKNSPEGLDGVEKRFVMFNGGIGQEQLAWFDKMLEEATDCQEKVFVCCHLPLNAEAASPSTLLWNFDEVMETVHKHKCVIACLSGHAHKGGHAVDSHGVHHRVLEAVLECPPGTDAYGHIDVFPDHLLLVGTGRMASTVMHF